MKNKLFVSVCLALAMILIGTAPPALAQTQSTNYRYGLSGWAINNQRVASQFNYDIDSLYGSGLGTFTFPCNTVIQALGFGGGKNVNPFNTNASVKIVDVVSANTENTVTLSAAPSCSGGTITLSLANSNSHFSYHLRSGTCGLQEAINDLGTTGGTVLIDQKFYDDGCTQSTITGITFAKSMANIFLLDISNGQYQPYVLKPTATTNIAAALAPTTATVAGGTFGNGNVIVCVTYVDILGGESTCQTNETTQATGGTTNGLTVTSPIASSGAVGYRVYMTAVGGSTGTEVLHTTATNCTQSTLITIFPVCAIGATSTVLAPITGTSKVPPLPTAHTLIAYQPINSLPSVSPSTSAGNTQLYSLSNAAVTVSSGTNADVAEIIVPAGYFNSVGKSWMVCAKIATATQVATAVITIKLNLIATARQQTAIAVSTLTFATQTQAAAGTIQGCAKWTTAATGASGTIMSSTPFGPWTNNLNSTPAQTVAASSDVSTAASGAVDLTKQTYLSLNFGAATANVTGVAVLDLTVTPLPGN